MGDEDVVSLQSTNRLHSMRQQALAFAEAGLEFTILNITNNPLPYTARIVQGEMVWGGRVKRNN